MSEIHTSILISAKGALFQMTKSIIHCVSTASVTINDFVEAAVYEVDVAVSNNTLAWH